MNLSSGFFNKNKGRTIALIRPDVPADFPLGRMKPTVPLGLLTVAGALREAGFDAVIIDDQLERKGAEWVAAEAKRSGAPLGGITVNLATVNAAGEICNRLKGAGISSFIGGPEVTANSRATLEATDADFGILGEGEKTAVAFAKSFFGDRDFDAVPGLARFDSVGGGYVFNEGRPWIGMDQVPLLPYDLLDLGRYDRSYAEFEADHVEVLNTSRGCPFRCTFCSNNYVWSRQYRAMSPETMVRHVRHALENTNATGIYFREDHFTLDRTRVLDFCDVVIREGLLFEWGCESRVDQLTPELVRRMREAGLKSIWFGIESGSDEVLQRLKKGITVNQIKEATRICRESGIKIGYSVMLGIPGETEADLRETIDLVFGQKPDWVYFAAFLGLPGSELYDYLKENPDLVFRRWNSMILPHCDYMTYPEKLKLKQELELRFNMQPRVLRGHLKRMGLKRFIEKALLNSIRILRTRMNPFNR